MQRDLLIHLGSTAKYLQQLPRTFFIAKSNLQENPKLGLREVFNPFNVFNELQDIMETFD